MIAMQNGSKKGLIGWLILTLCFGLGFLHRTYEFHHLIEEGAGPSAALSCRPSSRWWAPTVCT
jgi:heme/copper-type cytochrome/quinol oxidase subunit 3